MAMTERQMQARRAALIRHSRSDARESMRPAWEGTIRKIENEVDPRRELPEDERARRVERAYRAYMLGLSLKAVKAKRLKREAAAANAAAEAELAVLTEERRARGLDDDENEDGVSA